MSRNTKTNILIKNTVILGDFIILNILFFIYNYAYDGFIYNNDTSFIKSLFTANMSMAVAQYFFSTIVHLRRSTPEKVLRQVTLLVLVQGLVEYFMAEMVYIYNGYTQPNIIFILQFTFILYIGIILSRYVERWIIKFYRRSGHNIRQVLFIGSDNSIRSLFSYLANDPSMGYHIAGYYSDKKIENCPDKLNYLGTTQKLEEIITSETTTHIADDIYCCLPVEDYEKIKNVMRYCNNNVVHFYYIPAISQKIGHTFRLEAVGETMVFANHVEPLMKPLNKFIKRFFDIVMSLFVLTFVAIIIPFVALIIKIQSPGPIFFSQLRTGLNGENFKCYKFRSMHVNKDADLVQATEHDPRKFAFGNFMRKSNIDELPQFFNVLIGNMSIVGPRPHMLHHTDVYRKLIDTYMIRHFVKPGITGWAQVTGFRGETKELWQMEGRVKRDIWYIENWTIWLDLLIIWKTAKQMIVHDEKAY